MKYSIIIPTLNEEKLLPQLIAQLKNAGIQKNFDVEIIISDGGSSDSTVEIAMQNADKIICHTEKRKQTISEGRNLGAKIAEGEILVFLGADIKISDTQKFFELLERNFSNSSFVAGTCRVEIFPEEENSKDRIFHFILNKYFHILNIIGVGMGRGECQIVLKNVFEKLNGYNPKLAAGEDFDLFKRVRRTGKIFFSNEVCIYESPRRYRHTGYLNILKLWFLNAFFVILKKRSLNSNWEQIR